MTRKYCIHGHTKDAIEYTDAGNHSRTRRRKGMMHRDGHLGYCRHYEPGCKDVVSGKHDVCFNPENLWCIPNGCKIYEANLAWWNGYKPKLRRFLEHFEERTIPRYIDFMKKQHGVDVDFSDYNLVELIRLFQELSRILDHTLESRDLDLYIDCLMDDSEILRREMMRLKR